MTTTWTIAIDWDRNNQYTDSYDDVTSRTIMVDWFLGTRSVYQETADDALLRLYLNNADGRYSPENTTSPLYGKVAPFRTVRVQSNDGTTTRTHWIGWIESVQPSVGVSGERLLRITAAGPMQFLKAAETQIALQENQRTDAIISKLVDEVVIPPALSAGWFVGLAGYGEVGVSTWLANVTAYKLLEAGIVTLAVAANNWVDRGSAANNGRNTFNVYRAIADVAVAERGRFYFDRDGRAVFWNRLHTQDALPSQATFTDTMQGLEYEFAGLENFQNEVSVTCHPRTIGANANDVLWQLTDAITVPAGKSYTINVQYQDPTNQNARIGAKDVTLADLTFSEGVAIVSIDPKANSATLKISNTGTLQATLATASVKGRKITDYGQMDTQAVDGMSIAFYGRRRLKLNMTSVDDYEYARRIADYEVKRRGQPRGMVRQMTLSSHGIDGGNQHPQQVERTIGDVITLTESQTAHTGRRYLIIGESHRLTQGSRLFETTWYLEPAAEAPFPWKLGVAGRGEVDAATLLAF